MCGEGWLPSGTQEGALGLSGSTLGGLKGVLALVAAAPILLFSFLFISFSLWELLFGEDTAFN